MFLRSFASAACVASLVARADCLKTASDVNYTLGGWQSTAVSGQLSLAQASANVQIGLPPLAGGNGNGLTCGFLVAPGDAGRDLGDAWAQVNPTSPYAAKVRAVRPSDIHPAPCGSSRKTVCALAETRLPSPGHSGNGDPPSEHGVAGCRCVAPSRLPLDVQVRGAHSHWAWPAGFARAVRAARVTGA